MHSTVTSLTQRRGVRQFIKFAVVGVSGTLVNLVVYAALRHFIANATQGLQDEINYSIAFLAGGVSNFYFNRIWTFRSTADPVREGAQFLTVSLIALGVGLIVKWALAPSLGLGYAGWLAATVAGIFVNFFLNKYWTFKHVN